MVSQEFRTIGFIFHVCTFPLTRTCKGVPSAFFVYNDAGFVRTGSAFALFDGQNPIRCLCQCCHCGLSLSEPQRRSGYPQGCLFTGTPDASFSLCAKNPIASVWINALMCFSPGNDPQLRHHRRNGGTIWSFWVPDAKVSKIPPGQSVDHGEAVVAWVYTCAGARVVVGQWGLFRRGGGAQRRSYNLVAAPRSGACGPLGNFVGILPGAPLDRFPLRAAPGRQSDALRISDSLIGHDPLSWRSRVLNENRFQKNFSDKTFYIPIHPSPPYAPCPIGLSDRFGNRRGKRRGEKAIFGHLHANGSQIGWKESCQGKNEGLAVQHRQMCGQARTIPDCPSGTLPDLTKGSVCRCIEWEGCQPQMGIDMLAVYGH